LILDRVCAHYSVTIEPLRAHRKSDQLKPVATWLLTKLGGLSQREVANLLGVTTGAAISAQLKRLKEAPRPDQSENLAQLESDKAANLIFEG
jgi:hypothetical protein